MFLWMVYSSLSFTLMALIDDLRVTTRYWIPSTTHGFTPVLLDTRCISFWIFFWVCPKMLSLFHLVFIKLSLGLISLSFCNIWRKKILHNFNLRFSTAWGLPETDRRNAASRLLTSDMDWRAPRPRGDSCHLPWATLTCKMQKYYFL